MSKHVDMSYQDFNTIARIVNKYRHSNSLVRSGSIKLPKFHDDNETDDYITLFVKLRCQIKRDIGSQWSVYLSSKDSFKIDHHQVLGISVTDGMGNYLAEIEGNGGKRIGWTEDINDPHTLHCVNSIVRSFCHYIDIPFHLININGNPVDNL